MKVWQLKNLLSILRTIPGDVTSNRPLRPGVFAPHEKESACQSLGREQASPRPCRERPAPVSELTELRLKRAIKAAGIDGRIADDQIEDRAGVDIGQHGFPTHEVRRRLDEKGLSGDAGEGEHDVAIREAFGR